MPEEGGGGGEGYIELFSLPKVSQTHIRYYYPRSTNIQKIFIEFHQIRKSWKIL